jgi:hypothetical protein
MVYEGKNSVFEWSVGLATSANPEGPWKKWSGNPLLPAKAAGGSGFYVASVMMVNGSIWMYAEAPIGKYDQG